jgi:hypothetical protein
MIAYYPVKQRANPTALLNVTRISSKDSSGTLRTTNSLYEVNYRKGHLRECLAYLRNTEHRFNSNYPMAEKPINSIII